MTRSLTIRTLTALVLAVMALALAPAAHADSFRYWGYYQGQDGEWTFAPSGAEDTTPAQGDVEGWRFAVTDEASTKLPRAAADFDAICGDAAPADGMKRVAVVIDYGTPEDNDGETPPPAEGACAEVAEDASGGDVLIAVTDVRLEGGLVCGIGGWPATGCGDPVPGEAPVGDESTVALALPAEVEEADTDAAADGSESEDSSTAVIGILVAVGVIAALVVGLIAMRRRESVVK